MTPQRRSLAILGLLAAMCFAALPVTRLRLVEALVLVGVLLVVPIGLILAARGRPVARRWRLALAVHPIAAIACVASFGFPPGAIGGALALPWLAFTAFVALLGVLRLGERGSPRPLCELAIDIGLVELAVGGVWLTASRFGGVFMGFGEPIVLLTAAHFHFAGFALSVLVGLAARESSGRLWRAFGFAACAGVVCGVPLVAIGINLSKYEILWFEPIAAVWLALSATLVCVLQSRLAVRRRTRWSGRVMLVVSSSSLALGMALALVYASGQAFGWRGIDVPTMVRSHAVLNALGFAVPALLYWLVHESGRSGPGSGMRLNLAVIDASGTRPRAIASASELEHERRPGDVALEFIESAGREPPGDPVVGGCFERIADAIESFDIFPASALEPIRRPGKVWIGEIIAARAQVLPLLSATLAARVNSCFDERDGATCRRGFTYATIEGHPFVGEETFAVEKDRASGEVRVAIRSWSRPAVPIVRAVLPWARAKQRRAARAAVRRLAARGRL